MQHIHQDHCWVCSVRFQDASPPGPAPKERHHIIPRQAGGIDGPTVDLCGDHHTMLHKIANRLSSGRPHFDLVTGETDDSKKKIYWLATCVYNAFQATSKDPNKKVMVLVTLDQNQQKIMQALAKVYPNLKSREAIFDYAIKSLYAKHFME